MSQKLSKREALNEVAKVLEAALAEYESLEKMDFEGEESEEEKAEREAAAQAEAAQSQEAPAEEQAPSEEPSEEDMAAEAAQAEQAEGEEQAPSEEDEESEDEEMNDETLKSEFAKISKKMAARGLMKSDSIKKTEPAADLKKYESQISDLSKTVSDLQATIKKIANTPVSKGVKGYNPLKKNTEEEAKPLNKAEVINTILDLKKSGKSVPQGIVNRIEGNRLSEQDVNYIKGIVG